MIAAISLSACGGTIISSSADGGPPVDSGDTDTSPPDSSSPCAVLRQAYEYQLQQATVCCPVCNNVQCNHEQQGLCCPISTTAASIPAYTDALNAYLAAGCAVACPAMPCEAEPSNDCESPDPANPSAMGVCQ